MLEQLRFDTIKTKTLLRNRPQGRCLSPHHCTCDWFQTLDSEDSRLPLACGDLRSRSRPAGGRTLIGPEHPGRLMGGCLPVHLLTPHALPAETGLQTRILSECVQVSKYSKWTESRVSKQNQRKREKERESEIAAISLDTH